MGNVGVVGYLCSSQCDVPPDCHCLHNGRGSEKDRSKSEYKPVEASLWSEEEDLGMITVVKVESGPQQSASADQTDGRACPRPSPSSIAAHEKESAQYVEAEDSDMDIMDEDKAIWVP
mmetsp:Transcript_77721/g.137710  ORF Transcript_77721/g.137710 Transcript_77721/m.137710 type:complete len:118 (-) Transcript_77721:79-432(-)